MKNNMTLTGIARTISLSALLVILTACGRGDTAEEYLAKANQHIANSDYKSAVIELKNALKLDSQAAEARYLLGTAYLESGDMASARKELDRALQLGWSGEDLQPKLARALLAQGEFAKVREISAQELTPPVLVDFERPNS